MGHKRFFGRRAGVSVWTFRTRQVASQGEPGGQAHERHGPSGAWQVQRRAFRVGCPRSRREQVERAEKRELVATLSTVFKTAGVIVVAHNNGITVSQMNDLRSRMRKAGAAVKVAKNRLAMLALDGTDVAGIKDLFKGPTMIAYSSDPVTAPKIVAEFAKGNETLVVLGGALGASTLDPQGVKAR